MLDAAEKPKLFQRPPSPETVCADPFVLLDYDHSAQRALADLLEEIADSLPDEVNRAAAALAASQLRSAHARHAEIEDKALFSLLESRCTAETTRRAIATARREHHDAEGRAIELAEALGLLAERGACDNAESLGFMLRAFFDALRRHLDWVDAAILPQARAALTEADRVALGETLVAMARAETRSGVAGLAVLDGSPA